MGVTQAEERLRNCISADKLLISSSHPLAPSVIALYNRYAYMGGQCQVEAIEEIDPITRYSRLFWCVLRVVVSVCFFVSCAGQHCIGW